MAFSTVLMKYAMGSVLMDTPLTKPVLRKALKDYKPCAPGWPSWKSMQLNAGGPEFQPHVGYRDYLHKLKKKKKKDDNPLGFAEKV